MHTHIYIYIKSKILKSDKEGKMKTLRWIIPALFFVGEGCIYGLSKSFLKYLSNFKIANAEAAFFKISVNPSLGH